MKRIAWLFFMGFCGLTVNLSTSAQWIGPNVVLSGSWGGANGQFEINYGDSETDYPLITDVSKDGEIAISDAFNGRIEVYSSKGDLLWTITPPVDNLVGWFMTPKFVGGNLVIPIYNYYFYSSDGKLLTSVVSPGQSIFKGSVNGNLYVAVIKPNLHWVEYSPEASLLNTFNTKPLELGNIKDEIFLYQGKKLHRVNVSFPGAKWVIAGEAGPCGEYAYERDISGNLVCIDGQTAERYSACGKIIANFELPAGQYSLDSAPSENPGADESSSLILEYRGLILGRDGSLYASRATPDNFAVVKWIWQDSPDDPIGGPDAPVQLEGVSDTTGSVMLKWVYSLQDPGCVTGYEVGRATSAGGPYTAMGTVQPGDINKGYSYHDTTGKSGTTYYYAVRAVSAIGDSPYVQ
jgi:hypothetical protein